MLGAVIERGGYGDRGGAMWEAQTHPQPDINTSSPIKHHLLFHRRSWRVFDETNALRSHTQNIIRDIDIDRHLALHQEVSSVPVISSRMAQRAFSILDSFHPPKNPVIAIENLQRSIEATQSQRTFDPIELDIATVALTALELQKSFFYPAAPAKIIDLYPSKT